jgi:hypothetical protein
MKDYAKPVLGTMASDIASPVLHPIDTATALGHALMHPIDTAQGMLQTGKAALQGDPEAMGHALSLIAAPKVAEKTLGGVNSAAHAIAENPAVRSGIGYIGGAGTALATGAGHPFIGAAAGRIASPLLKGPAAEVAGGTDWLMNKLGMKQSAPGGLAPADLSALQKFSPEADLSKVVGSRSSSSPAITMPDRPSQFEAEFPMGEDVGKEVAPTGKLPPLKAADMVRIRNLMDSGLSAEQAYSRVSGSPGLSRLVKIGPETP